MFFKGNKSKPAWKKIRDILVVSLKNCDSEEEFFEILISIVKTIISIIKDDNDEIE